jgi:hypothetical protein
MLLWANDFRAVFWVAVFPAVLAVLAAGFGMREPAPPVTAAKRRTRSARGAAAAGRGLLAVVAIGAVFTLARFSEAFLVLRAPQVGVPLPGAAGDGGDEPGLRGCRPTPSASCPDRVPPSCWPRAWWC